MKPDLLEELFTLTKAACKESFTRFFLNRKQILSIPHQTDASKLLGSTKLKTLPRLLMRDADRGCVPSNLCWVASGEPAAFDLVEISPLMPPPPSPDAPPPEKPASTGIPADMLALLQKKPEASKPVADPFLSAPPPKHAGDDFRRRESPRQTPSATSKPPPQTVRDPAHPAVKTLFDFLKARFSRSSVNFTISEHDLARALSGHPGPPERLGRHALITGTLAHVSIGLRAPHYGYIPGNLYWTLS